MTSVRRGGCPNGEHDAVGEAYPSKSEPVGSSEVTLRIVLARPTEHTLRAVVTDSSPAEWDVAANERELEIYVNHYAQNGVVATITSSRRKSGPRSSVVAANGVRRGGSCPVRAERRPAASERARRRLERNPPDRRDRYVCNRRPGNGAGGDHADDMPRGRCRTSPPEWVRRWRSGHGALGRLPAQPVGNEVARTVRRTSRRSGRERLPHRALPCAADRGPAHGVPARDPRDLPGTQTERPRTGAILKQLDLAKTLRLLARDGASAFYEGEIASAIVEATRRAAVPGREGR